MDTADTLRRDESGSAGIDRILEGKIDAAIGHVDGGMDRHETVHEVRKRCKEIRAALRLVRGVLPTYSAENAHYRDAARRLSDIRDAQALVETFDDHVTPAVESADVQNASTDEQEAGDEDLPTLEATCPSRRTGSTPSPAASGNRTSGRETGWPMRTWTPTPSGSTSGASGCSTTDTTRDCSDTSVSSR